MSTVIGTLREIRTYHEDGVEILNVVRSCLHSADDTYGLEFSVAAALYWLSADWHGGMHCPLYLGQCTGFEPGPSHRGIEDEEDCIALNIYRGVDEILSRDTITQPEGQ